MTDNSEVWRVIRDARDDHGWTNQRLAEESGVPESSVQKITTGKILNPSFDSIIAICCALDLSVDKLCGIDSNAAVDEIAQLRAALALAEERRKTAEAQREVADTKLDAQIHEYNQMVDAYEYRISIASDRTIWHRVFLVFTCIVILSLIACLTHSAVFACVMLIGPIIALVVSVIVVIIRDRKGGRV